MHRYLSVMMFIYLFEETQKNNPALTADYNASCLSIHTDQLTLNTK